MANKCPKCETENPPGYKYCIECASPLTSSDPGSQPEPREDKTDSSSETWEVPLESLSTGSIFAERYQIIEELGKGGMGRVYKVLDKEINVKVALKLLKPEIVADDKTIERFRNELKTAREISHKNVCRMYDLNKKNGTYYITMEYVPGQDLKDLIRQLGKLTIGKAVTMTQQICEGLTEAHRLGIIHRDLKPGNVMIDDDGNVRIMDFGIARSLKEKGITGVGLMVGTPEYMSPEQAEGKDIDQRSDIYSLGMMLYEMVTGRLPFEGETALSIVLKHKTEVPPDPRMYNAQIPPQLCLLILKCMEKDRKKRYQSIEEIVSELKEISEKVSSLERTFTERKGTFPEDKKAASKKRWVGIAALFLLIVVAGLAVRYLINKGPAVPTGRKMLVVMPFDNLGPPGDEYFAAGVTEEITSRLAALQGLGVISRTSAVQYRDTNKTIKQIGEELSVDYVLEGSVRWNRSAEAKDRVRVTPQLVRVNDDTHIWSERYDRILEDLFAVQSEIAEQVARQLDLTVLEPERRILNARPTDNLEAYDYYLQAREHEDKGWAFLDTQEFELAMELLERATELDPGFALAFTRQSYIHSRMYFFGIDRTGERLERSRDAVNKALELQPDFPEAQRMLGFYYYWGLSDYNRAAEIFESVQKARPNFDTQLLGYIQRRQGKWEECIETLERAFKINPLDQQIANELGGANISMHRYEEAEKWFNRVLSLYPDHLTAQLGRVGIFVLSEGDTEKALALWEELPEHQLKDYMWFNLNMFQRNFNEMLAWLTSLPYDSYEDQHFYFEKNLAKASVYNAMNDLSLMETHADAARIILEKAVNERVEDPRFHAALGLVYAYLGRKEEAIQEGNLAAKLHPESRDAAQGPIYLLNLAKIYTVAEEYDRAIDQLEHLLSIPQAEFLWQLVSVPQLRLDPQWDSLREHPRFRQLLNEE